jgi:tRNA(Arg) A34 adenosine deaminase TadA
MNDAAYMGLAIAKAREGIEQGQTPFGACIVRDGEVLACAHNEVWATCDITAHAEIQALRAACAMLKAVDLKGATIYCTCEPCPMCFGAIHWAKISRIVYGAEISDAKTFGFNELTISNSAMKKLGNSGVEIEDGCLVQENRALFKVWKEASGRTY